MESNKKVFRSRISVLVTVFVLGLLISVSIMLIKDQVYQGLYTIGGVFVFFILLFGGMRYIISGNKLYFKMWFIPNGSINIADIKTVKRTYNPLASNAASLKRLQINDYWLISPAREKEFVEALKAVNPNIVINIPEKKGKWRIWDWDI